MPRGISNNRDAAGKPVRVNRADERRALRPAVIDPNQFYSIEETAAARDQSVARAWDDIRNNRLRATRDGKRVKVLGAHIIAANLAQAENVAHMGAA